LDEMSNIMEVLHKYVPTHASEGQFALPNGSTLSYDNTTFFEILLGGDQLTVVHVSGVQSLRIGHETAMDRLEGLVPVVEDWHARVILLEVHTLIQSGIIIVINKPDYSSYIIIMHLSITGF